MDEELRRRARAARSEIEARVDVEAELAGRPAGPTSSIAPITPLPPRGRVVAVTGSIAAVAVAIVGGVVLLRGPDSIETSEPSAPIAAVSTSTTTFAPSTDPEATSPLPTTTLADTSVSTIEGAAPSTTMTTGTSAPSPTTTSTTTTTSPPTVPTTVPGSAVSWQSLPWEGAGIERTCADEFVDCTQIGVDRVGSIVSYDPTTRTLIRHTTPPVEATLSESLANGSFLWHLGPDDVVYLGVPNPQDEYGVDVVGVALAADDAGRELARWPDVSDSSGDSELVVTRDGLVDLDCCGPATDRPEPGAPVLVPWLGRDGQPTAIDGPVMRTEVEFPMLTVHRDDDLPAGTRSWTFEPPPNWQPRGMPTVIPTFDGGFIAVTFDGVDNTVIRGWVDGTIDMITIDTAPDFTPPTLDPNGRATVVDGDRFARFEPFGDRTEYWAGRPEVADDGTVTLPDIDTAIEFEAGWARDPVAFGNAVAGQIAVNERRTIEYERPGESEFTVTVTTSNFFDDSVFATRLELTLSRDDDGRFRFESGQQTHACQPGRGHEDFSTELCV